MTSMEEESQGVYRGKAVESRTVPAALSNCLLEARQPVRNAQWKGSRHIVVPAAGHNTSADGCVMRLMADFLNRGNASEIDASCVKRLKRPPFFVGPSGPEPMTAVTH